MFKSLHSQSDLSNTIGQAWHLGLDGVIIWDDHNLSDTTRMCLQTKNYVDETLGPFVKELLQGGVEPEVKSTSSWWENLKMLTSLVYGVFTFTGVLYS